MNIFGLVLAYPRKTIPILLCWFLSESHIEVENPSTQGIYDANFYQCQNSEKVGKGGHQKPLSVACSFFKLCRLTIKRSVMSLDIFRFQCLWL